MNQIKPTELKDNAIRLIGQEWMLISAGTKDGFNTMTANWGGIGYLWNKPVVFVFVRPERYTYEFIEQQSDFTLSFFPEGFKKALSLLGTKSGRDTDKITESGLLPRFTEEGNPYFEEARLVLECRKLFKTRLEEADFLEKEILDQWYSAAKGQLHYLYVAEIKSVYEKENS